MVIRNMLKKAVTVGIACMLAFSPLTLETAGAGMEKFNMSYIYFGDSSSYIYHVEQTKDSLNEVSPNYFNINDDGTLKLTSAVDTAFVKEMHKRGIKVVPFLSNHWDREKGISALNSRKALAREIANAVKKYDLDGIHVDIENLTEAERDSYTDFVRLLRSELPSGKVVAVAVAANPFWADSGWQGSYDYEGLARYSDYLMVMAYDEHYQGGTAGPVASGPFVERSIKYALERVPKEKIVLGIPFYGRYWKNGEKYGGYGISADDVEELVKKYKGKVEFDSASQSPKAVIQIKPNDVKPRIMGRELTAGTYTIWYENEQSIKYKLKLVQKYDLKGTGSWSLGQEYRSTWDYYSMWLNGYYFEDVAGHWAQGHILSVIDKEWMKGISGNRFAPNNPLTRAEAAAVLVRALGLKEKKGIDVNFSDISNHWVENEIKIAAQHGLVLGKGDGTFAPNQYITRQEIAVMLDRALTKLGLEGKGHNPYKDVNAKDLPWSYDSILKLTDYGIFTGGTDGKFHPLNTALRAEMAAIMDRISALLV